VAELVRLKRHTGNDALYTHKEFQKLSEGDLYVEALLDHEGAKAEWRKAETREAVKNAINKMEHAVELRDQLGDVRGLCASTNVLGNMYQRLAEWYEWESPLEPHLMNNALDQAEKQRTYSMQLAENHELGFDLFAAQFELSVFYLRSGTVN